LVYNTKINPIHKIDQTQTYVTGQEEEARRNPHVREGGQRSRFVTAVAATSILEDAGDVAGMDGEAVRARA